MPFEQPIGDPCAFCEVIVGRTDKEIVVETGLTLTLISWRQYEVGQMIVIPRRHAPTLLDLSDEEASAVMHGVRRIADALVATFDPDGMTLYQNNGVVSRQEVPHFHMHVVPRRKDSNWGKGPPQIAVLENRDESIVRRVKISAERELELAEQIRSNL